MIVSIILSVILLCVAIIVFFVQNSLVLSEFSQSDLCGLAYYSPLNSLIILLLFMAILLFLTGLLLRCRLVKNDNNKKVVAICGLLLSVAIGFTTISVYKTFSETNISEYSKDVWGAFVEEHPKDQLPEKYNYIFPYFEKIQESFGDSAYYFFKNISTEDGIYVHAQNCNLDGEKNVVFDVELFSSDKRRLMNNYIIQKKTPIVSSDTSNTVLEGDIKVLDGIKYIVYVYDDYYQIRVIEKDHYFSIVFDNLSVIEKNNSYSFEETAIEIYKNLIRDFVVNK